VEVVQGPPACGRPSVWRPPPLWSVGVCIPSMMVFSSGRGSWCVQAGMVQSAVWRYRLWAPARLKPCGGVSACLCRLQCRLVSLVCQEHPCQVHAAVWLWGTCHDAWQLVQCRAGSCQPSPPSMLLSKGRCREDLPSDTQLHPLAACAATACCCGW
jgi:hypothetical protein